LLNMLSLDYLTPDAAPCGAGTGGHGWRGMRCTFAALFDRFIQNLRRYVGYDGLAGGGHPSFLHESPSGFVKGDPRELI
jgi:hypothetical protein